MAHDKEVPPPKVIVVVGGKGGCGKTWLAQFPAPHRRKAKKTKDEDGKKGGG